MTGWDELRTEAVRLVSDAAGLGIELRALGSVGVRLHCGRASDEMDVRGRVPKDIDLVARREDRRKVRGFFESEGYEADRDMLVAMEGTRYLFRSNGVDIDVWIDVLDFCHRLEVADRLGTGPSLSIEDLLLSKLQIVELMPNDRHDIAAILATHDVGLGSEDPEVIDSAYLARVLSADWGFWRTATGNLDAITPDLDEVAAHRARQLVEQIEAAPRTTKWKIRARLGDRVQWWQEVDIPRSTY